MSLHAWVVLACVQDGSAGRPLQVHIDGLKAVFLRRTLSDCAHYGKLLCEESRRLWPPTHQQPSSHAADCAVPSIQVIETSPVI